MRARSRSRRRSPERFADLDRQHEIGELKIKISGCINACGHHHAGHIGILGVDKKGVEFYQLQLGGSGAEDATIGDDHGPRLRRARDRRCGGTRGQRLSEASAQPGERFLDTYRRIGMEPFKDCRLSGGSSRVTRLIKNGAYRRRCLRARRPTTRRCPTAR